MPSHRNKRPGLGVEGGVRVYHEKEGGVYASAEGTLTQAVERSTTFG